MEISKENPFNAPYYTKTKRFDNPTITMERKDAIDYHRKSVVDKDTNMFPLIKSTANLILNQDTLSMLP